MSDLKAKVAYLQGLSNGLNIEADSKDGKILNNIISVLGEIADSFTELEDAHEQLEDYVETIDEDLYSLETEISGNGAYDDYVEVDCPGCGEAVLFDPGILEDDDVVEVTCPNCDDVVFVNDDYHLSADEPEDLQGLCCCHEQDI